MSKVAIAALGPAVVALMMHAAWSWAHPQESATIWCTLDALPDLVLNIEMARQRRCQTLVVVAATHQ
jgi:hypothetical protein